MEERPWELPEPAAPVLAELDAKQAEDWDKNMQRIFKGIITRRERHTAMRRAYARLQKERT